MQRLKTFFTIICITTIGGCLEIHDKLPSDQANADDDASSSNPTVPKRQTHAARPTKTPRPESECKTTPPNLVVNASFESRPIHACGWETFDGSEWGVIASRYCYLDDHQGCALYLAAEAWGNDWIAQLYQRLALQPHDDYLLTFEAKAAGVDRPLVVAALNAGPLNGLGSGIELNLDTNWHTFAFPFTAGPGAEESILDFAFGGADTGLYLDNVSLIPNPPSPALDAGSSAMRSDAQ